MRGELIETVDGVPIRKKTRNPRLLHVGDLVQLDEGGPTWEVEYVSPCAATIRLLHPEPKIVEIPGRDPFEATRGKRLQIAPTAVGRRV